MPAQRLLPGPAARRAERSTNWMTAPTAKPQTTRPMKPHTLDWKPRYSQSGTDSSGGDQRQDERLAQLGALGLAPGQQRADGDERQHDDAERLGDGVVRVGADGAVEDQRHDHGAEGDGDREQREQQVGEVVEEVARQQADSICVVALEAAPAPGDEADAGDGGDHEERRRGSRRAACVLLEGVHRLMRPVRVVQVARIVKKKVARGQGERPALEEAARLVEREGVQQGGGGEPRHQRGVLHRVPGPVAAEARAPRRPTRRRGRCRARGRASRRPPTSARA